MPNPTGINLALSPVNQSGLSVSAQFLAAGAVVVAHAVPEVGTGTARYYLAESAITGLAAGAYVVACYAGGELVGGPDPFIWSGTTELPLGVDTLYVNGTPSQSFEAAEASDLAALLLAARAGTGPNPVLVPVVDSVTNAPILGASVTLNQSGQPAASAEAGQGGATLNLYAGDASGYAWASGYGGALIGSFNVSAGSQVAGAVGLVRQAAGGLTDQESDQLAAVVTAVTQLGAGQLSYTGPVATDGSARIVQGDDATLQWTVAGYVGPSLVGASVAFGVVGRCEYDRDPTIAPLLAVAGTAATTAATDGSTTVVYTVPLTSSQTTALPSAPMDRPLNLVGHVVVTTAGGARLTAVLAAVTVVRRVV